MKDVLNELQNDGHIPETVKIRDFFGITLLEKIRMRRSLERGIVGGYEMGRAVSNVKKITAESGHETLDVKIGRVCLMDRRDNSIVLRIEEDSVLQAEREAIVNTLVGMGLRGLEEGRPFKPHLRAAEAKNPISVTEKLHVTHVLEDMLTGQMITLLPLQIGEPK